ncbi:hypothetical protein O181_118697 [Austropuccinia psidii MF-1]|uniref:Uncharacterized protein n=1 Tax=Austropuccinia psidii MF-1 TaxID=1389203 RepID=A0A9Q3KDN9_9BASI|nr:hypothetical protein [Austropuccinia psidii MF-1]
MQDSRNFTTSQRSSRTVDTHIENHETKVMIIPVFRCEKLPKSSSRNIPVSVEEPIYGSKEAGVKRSAQLVDRENELLPSSEEAFVSRKDKQTSERLETNFFQWSGTKDNVLVEKLDNFVRGSEDRVGPKKQQQTCESSPSPQNL